ncbi:UNVERIFIED_CONTAM: hypothetical protein Slati_4602300 [Sesamum latifolium]|uniref:Uncharacterized protein n=1 Tax=Sesamum latifolium TaxID=2727402 RepID=A0AAW2S407_9LAMI
MGTIDLPVSMGEEPRRRTAMGGCIHLSPEDEIPTRNGVGEVSCDTKEVKCGPDGAIVKQEEIFRSRENRIIEEEVNKLKEAGYVSEVQYTDWLANVVVVPKASEKWRMCTDFTDLNKACPKDPYPLPRIDLLVDSTVGYELFSMMDAYQGTSDIHG